MLAATKYVCLEYHSTDLLFVYGKHRSARKVQLKRQFDERLRRRDDKRANPIPVVVNYLSNRYLSYLERWIEPIKSPEPSEKSLNINCEGWYLNRQCFKCKCFTSAQPVTTKRKERGFFCVCD